MAQAVEVAGLQRRLQVKLTSPFPAALQLHGHQATLVHGHEAAIRVIDAGNCVCLCCPAPLHNNGMLKSGMAFNNVLLHASSKQHAACVAHWVKVKRMQHLMRRLRLFARVAGRVLPWHARALERAYAPGGPGFEEAKKEFQAHAGICV